MQETLPRRSIRAIAATLGQTLLGQIYMLHWIPIMASTTARMSVRPKRLKWVKTVHHGVEEELGFE
jgi:1,2-diacylglycerol 3-beta-glucosyltransferase